MMPSTSSYAPMQTMQYNDSKLGPSVSDDNSCDGMNAPLYSQSHRADESAPLIRKLSNGCPVSHSNGSPLIHHSADTGQPHSLDDTLQYQQQPRREDHHQRDMNHSESGSNGNGHGLHNSANHLTMPHPHNCIARDQVMCVHDEQAAEQLRVLGIPMVSAGGGTKKDSNTATRLILDQERFLPIANVARVMKKMIPSAGKIAKDAKECVQECVSEFISFITSEASDKCMEEKRKTISAEDLMDALTATGFDNYIEPMKEFLERYRVAHKMPAVQQASVPMTFPVMNSNGRATNPSTATSSGGGGGGQNSDSRRIADAFFTDPPPAAPATSQAQSAAVNRRPPNLPMNVEDAGPSNDIPGPSSFNDDMHDMSPSEDTSSANNLILQPKQLSVVSSVDGAVAPGMTLEPQQMQIYVDQNTKQHYVAIDAPEGGGVQLFPISIQGGPVDVDITVAEDTSRGQDFMIATTEPHPQRPSTSSQSSSLHTPIHLHHHQQGTSQQKQQPRQQMQHHRNQNQGQSSRDEPHHFQNQQLFSDNTPMTSSHHHPQRAGNSRGDSQNGHHSDHSLFDDSGPPVLHSMASGGGGGAIRNQRRPPPQHHPSSRPYMSSKGKQQ